MTPAQARALLREAATGHKRTAIMSQDTIDRLTRAGKDTVAAVERRDTALALADDCEVAVRYSGADLDDALRTLRPSVERAVVDLENNWDMDRRRESVGRLLYGGSRSEPKPSKADLARKALAAAGRAWLKETS
jgi:hypothetical protein